MKRTSKPAAFVAALLLVLGLVSGCGGNDSSSPDALDDGGSAGAPPTNATVEEFCGGFTDLIQQASQAGQDISDADAIKLAKQAADKLAEIGSPEDIPADAREAFVLAIEKVRSIPDDATRKELGAIADDLTDAQRTNLDALTRYVATTCLSLPSDLPSS
ncbi:MAG: hypothetical protein ABWZ91_05500 [Nocardioides sp.]